MDNISEDGWHRYDAMMGEADMAGQIERQRAEIVRLRAALEPFAEHWRKRDVYCGHVCRDEDFKRAFDALTAAK